MALSRGPCTAGLYFEGPAPQALCLARGSPACRRLYYPDCLGARAVMPRHTRAHPLGAWEGGGSDRGPVAAHRTRKAAADAGDLWRAGRHAAAPACISSCHGWCRAHRVPCRPQRRGRRPRGRGETSGHDRKEFHLVIVAGMPLPTPLRATAALLATWHGPQRGAKASRDCEICTRGPWRDVVGPRAKGPRASAACCRPRPTPLRTPLPSLLPQAPKAACIIGGRRPRSAPP